MDKVRVVLYRPGVSGTSQIDGSGFCGLDVRPCASPAKAEEGPLFVLTPKGMAPVDVNTGRSLLFIATGVEVLGGSHFSGSCCGIGAGGGPSG
jgi:hypothetical protein